MVKPLNLLNNELSLGNYRFEIFNNMHKTTKLYMTTFIGVGIIILLFGFIGINISLRYIQKHYIQLQIDVNKRQAERMAFMIEKQIKKGIPLDTIRSDFQASIVGTEFDKGFLCMYDTRQNALVCHPDAKAVGLMFTKDFIFKDANSNSKIYIGDIYNTKKPAGGIFIQGNMRTDIIYTIPVEGTNWYINAHENINAISLELNQLRNKYILGSILLGLVIAIAASVTARRISRNYEKKIEQQNVEITHQRDEIITKNKAITDSINYAQKIQAAVLPSETILNQLTNEYFIIYKPKDIISGDFFWFSNSADKFILAAADCTGHGVPGAFMSMLGITLLNELVNHQQLDEAPEILNRLRESIKQALRQEGQDNQQKDGMDISLCVIDKKMKNIQFAGANNPLYLFRKNESNAEVELIEYKADRMPIGVYPKDKTPFTSQVIQIIPGDAIYLFSDGFASQFGGNDGSTFKSKKLKDLLASVQPLELPDQKEQIELAFNEWKGKFDQIDDVLLLGIRLS